MARMRRPTALRREWKTWRMRVSEPFKDHFRMLVRITNATAKENGYSDIGESWREELGMEDVVKTVLSLWSEVKPLYRELHAYTRHKLLKLYGDAELGRGPYIPAHLLGSLWAENWLALSDVLLPFPPSTAWKFRNQSHLLQTAEHFYTAMGFDAMSPTFWSNSMFVKPKDRIVDCHAMSYDFALNRDYRVRMCVDDAGSFAEAVHELGHVHYSQAYRRLPVLLRRAPNSAFHEAVGETLSYAAHSPRCRAAETESLINTLMKQALSKLVLLPWALTVEMWRYNLFSGRIQEADMLSKWWEFRREFQGVDPPDLEGSLLFDPASKYHVALNIPYLRYFLSRFLEHHFLEALCSAAGHPIHNCCFVTSSTAGKRFRSMLSLGASVSWQKAFWMLTRGRRLSSKPLLKYYKPLHDWLIQHNSANNITASW